MPKFQEIYDKVGSKIYDLLQMLDSYITICVSNAIYQALVTNCQQSNQMCQGLGQPPKYDETEIGNYKNKIIDIEPHRKKLLAALDEISKYNQNEIQQLSALAREYIAQRQKNAYKTYFSHKEG